MTIPNFVFGLLIAFLVGTLFHAFRGGNGWRLLIFVGLSIAGFFLAQWLGNLVAWELLRFGFLDIGLGVVGSVLFLIVGQWLLGVEPNKKSGV